MKGPTRQLQVLDGDDDGALLKVAFASADRIQVDQHFGSSRAFVIYGVNRERAKVLSVAEFAEQEQEQDGNEDKLIGKLDLLDGCAAVYCKACGASAVRQLLSSGIQPIKVSQTTDIHELIEILQTELREGPSAWLARAIQRIEGANGQRFDVMADQTWDE